ncbi:hypothetical protein ACWGI1_00090 [Streptomyces sp. NPDC054835]|uniref:hypothetical protein n=1 Tax=Streptomyces exfoliatus TaxID=1905 RepID=UPI000463BF76|nr:hypothetical protein [Streptomyces exfoliatus]
MTDESPDYGLDDFEPAAPCHQDLLDLVETPVYKVLGEYRTGTDAYFVLYDEGAPWGIPGAPQLRAVHVARDLRARTFKIDTTELPLVAMAESWLIARGCPNGVVDPACHRPADAITRALEARVRRDGDHFALLTSYSDDERDSPETVAMLRSLDPQARPEFRILLERYDEKSGTHTLREGGFASHEQAVAWWTSWWQGDAPPLPAPAPSLRQATAVAPLPASPAGPRQLRL